MYLSAATSALAAAVAAAMGSQGGIIDTERLAALAGVIIILVCFAGIASCIEFLVDCSIKLVKFIIKKRREKK